MSMHFREIAEKAAADGVISAGEILALRKAGWANGQITPEEAEAIFQANNAVADPSAEWADFFVEAIQVFIVNTLEPAGYVTQEQADWLIAKVDHNGNVDSMTELEMLVRVFETATSVPDSLREYALAQVERAVLTGEGPTRCGGTLETGNVTLAEANLMRRIVFSTGSERPAAVSRKEADMLFRLKDATLGADNAPEWQRLFVQGVGNYLMGFVRHTALSRERAGELNAFMNDTNASVGGFFARVGKSAVKGNFFEAIGDIVKKAPSGPDTSELAAIERAVTTSEQMWLEDRLDGNGQIDAYDQALLDFLNEESGFTR